MNFDANTLTNAASLYLRQHASNPVHWHEWSDEVWRHAQSTNRLVIVSIGYSACHWCHVMEHQSFEDESVAELMNAHFVCIKVDREERPDLDQFYMDAVQLMSGRGGWPLNVICVSDARPIYGGTYFPKEQWVQILTSLAHIAQTEPERVQGAAKDSMQVLQQTLVQPVVAHERVYFSEIVSSLRQWQLRFDPQHGADKGAPKFPIPCTLRFQLNFARCVELYADEAEPRSMAISIQEHVYRSLRAMYRGGIWDQLGGGFARYSTDARWKLPHFEKMLYDNAQLISLAAQCHTLTPHPDFETIIRECIDFLERDMRSPNGCYYAALDADSEGEEGLYYTWTPTEIQELLGDDSAVFERAFSMSAEECLEDGRYVLFRTTSIEQLASEFKSNVEDLERLLHASKKKLLLSRMERIPPGVDTKLLCSWNALCVSAFADAAKALDDVHYAQRAEDLLNEIVRLAYPNHNALLHCLPYAEYEQRDHIAAFADDYACLAMACLDVHELSGNEHTLDLCERLLEQALQNFARKNSSLLNYSSIASALEVHSRPETHDTVLPSSNAHLAQALLECGVIRARSEFIDRAHAMILEMKDEVLRSPSHHAHWLNLMLAAGLSTSIVRSAVPDLSLIQQVRHNAIPFVRSIDAFESQIESNSVEICNARSCSTTSANTESISKHLKKMRGTLNAQRVLIEL